MNPLGSVKHMQTTETSAIKALIVQQLNNCLTTYMLIMPSQHGQQRLEHI